MKTVPLGAEWIGPWAKCPDGWVVVTRRQAVELRRKMTARMLCTLWQPLRPRKARDGTLVQQRAEFLFMARPEDLRSAGLPENGRGWGRRKKA